MDLISQAEQLARVAHRGQVDKAGLPYIGHPERVAARVTGDAATAVAWLHDVVEDTPITLDDLHARFPAVVVAAVDALTRRPGEDPDTYYSRVMNDPLAIQVKLADLADNSDPDRLSRLAAPVRTRLEAKYALAQDRLSRVGGGV